MSYNEWILGHFICVCAVWTLLLSVHMACCHGHTVALPDVTVLELWSTGEHQGLPTIARPAPTCQGLSFSFFITTVSTHIQPGALWDPGRKELK